MKSPNQSNESQVPLQPGFPEWLRVSFVEELPLCVILKDLDGKFTYVNKQTARLFGLPAEAIVGKTDFDLYPNELAQKYWDDDRMVIQSGQAIEQIEKNVTVPASRIVKVRKTPLRCRDGKIIGIEVLFWDVTAHQEAEANLEQERFLLQSLLNHLPDFIYFKDLESRFLRVSRAHASRLGLSNPADAIGSKDSDYFTKPYADAARMDELQLIRSGQNVLGREEHACWPDGSETWVATSKLPLRDEGGKTVGTFGISRDISELKAAAEALERAKQVAEAASRAKSEFVANLSHEIRTPMNAIIGMAELLANSGLDEQRTEQARTILESGECLLRLLNDILDFSRIESGRVELDPVPGDLSNCVQGAIRLMKVQANEKSIKLEARVNLATPDFVVADFVRLRQILVNLIGNAIKFTAQGGVTLSVDHVSRINQMVTLQFAVSDTGIGIPNDKLDVIFEEFEQADKSTTRRFGGTGLGLAITSRLVKLMGGQIKVKSQTGLGSTFSFSLTFPVADETETSEFGDPNKASSSSQTSSEPLRILLAEDGETNQMVATILLEGLGHQVKIAHNGCEAVQLSDTESFDLILMDLEMPEMDGIQATRQIRNREYGTNRHMPIIAMTAHAMESDEQRCLEAGMDAYIAKPIRQNNVFVTIENLMKKVKSRSSL
ncbi:PAS domain-containing sensor histidine kinase [Novipirellula aureliae]|nr:PAS domain-containing sensor histidine kinase [Novipirellula aureliae]